MSILGHLIALLGLYGLYTDVIVFGSVLFCLGGFIARKMFVSPRSAGVLTMVVSIAYGYHNGLTPTVLFMIFVGFVLACSRTKRTSLRSDDGWGIDIDFSSFGSSSDSGGGDSGVGGD